MFIRKFIYVKNAKTEYNLVIKSVIVICLTTEHLKAHENSLKRVRAFLIELEFGRVGS